MFEKYLERLLKENLGDFIEEIDSKELNVGLWSGKVDIKNVRLKKHLFQKYKLPIVITYSAIKGLSLKIPWKSLFTSPLVITIDSLIVLCEWAH
jgi:vacuolar protein sorting-associated protein 13A/C